MKDFIMVIEYNEKERGVFLLEYLTAIFLKGKTDKKI